MIDITAPLPRSRILSDIEMDEIAGRKALETLERLVRERDRAIIDALAAALGVGPIGRGL